MARPSREWNSLPDVVNARCKQDKPLKAQAKARMGNSAVFAQIQVA